MGIRVDDLGGGRNPLTGLNLVQLASRVQAVRAWFERVAIPLRG